MGRMTKDEARRALVESINSALSGMEDGDYIEDSVGVRFEVDESGDDFVNITVSDEIEDGKDRAFKIQIKDGWS